MKSRNDKALAYKPANKGFGFRNLAFYWSARVTNKYTHKMEVNLKKVGLTITGWRVGMILNELGPLSISEIAEHASCRMPTITKTAYKMQESGYLDIRAQVDDGRVSIVTITSKGCELFEDIISNTKNIFDTAFVGLSNDQLMSLNSMLETISNNLSRE